jgi:glutathione S-transferase
MRLYGSPASPYARKVRVVALELDIALELERADAHAMPSNYGLINPINRIPALRLDDGSMMFDSRVICEYLDSLKGHRLLPQAGAARWHTLKLQALGDGVLDAAVPRYSELLRPPEQRSPNRLAKYERSIRQILDALAGSVADLEGLNLGTLTIACALGYLDFRFAGDGWRGTRPALSLWYERLAGRPSLAETQPAP